jgi:hypothetical protein
MLAVRWVRRESGMGCVFRGRRTDAVSRGRKTRFRSRMWDIGNRKSERGNRWKRES